MNLKPDPTQPSNQPRHNVNINKRHSMSIQTMEPGSKSATGRIFNRCATSCNSNYTWLEEEEEEKISTTSTELDGLKVHTCEDADEMKRH